MQEIAVGVIGTGGMGARHAFNLHAHVVGARVEAVHDIDAKRAQEAAEAAGGARVCADPHELIRDAAVDAVVIVSPDATHADLTSACLEAGKPVLCEKPLATTAARALQVVEQEVAVGRRLVSVGFMRRFDPPHVAVKQAIEADAIGQALLFKGASRAAMMPGDLPIATIMTNTAIHDLDSMRWIMGREPVEIHARALRTHAHFPAEARDLFLLTMVLEGNGLATIEVAMATEYGYDIEATVVGQKGVLETTQPDVALLRKEGRRGFGYPKDWLVRFQPAYVAELEAWIGALHKGKPFPGASAWDGYMATLVAETCTEALRTGALTHLSPAAKPSLYA